MPAAGERAAAADALTAPDADPTRTVVESEMIHVWHIFAGRVPEATAAVERVGAFLRQHLRGAR